MRGKFAKDNFDKLLLAFILMYMVHVVLALALSGAMPEVVSWARELASAIAGALIGLITGIAAGQKMERDKQEEGKKDE